MVFSYNYIEAKNEKELQMKLVKLQVKSGYTYKIINIYPVYELNIEKGFFNKIRDFFLSIKPAKVVAWYYANPKDALNGN